MDSFPNLPQRNSQDPTASFSFSLPSEPPDIGNWFSSYVYESLVSGTSSQFEDSVSSKENGREIQGKDEHKVSRVNLVARQIFILKQRVKALEAKVMEQGEMITEMRVLLQSILKNKDTGLPLGGDDDIGGDPDQTAAF
ncbi:hypothetical protein QN277_010547 [Acacia crassicarpa]|uniref:Uncharacterized protein n=1 Tax=Acacia crassicarpa TaxID=499986 RepID=A0AAE1INT7_9FABA|nr:hypothetical protein QN277_010547 [Acacia crassicarpa]